MKMLEEFGAIKEKYGTQPASGIWAAFDPLPLVTLIKYIDFRVFRVSGVSWGNLNRIHIWGTKWEFHRGTHVNL